MFVASLTIAFESPQFAAFLFLLLSFATLLARNPPILPCDLPRRGQGGTGMIRIISVTGLML